MIIPDGFGEAAIYTWVDGDPEVMVNLWGIYDATASTLDQGDCDNIYTAYAEQIRDVVMCDGARFGGVTLRVNDGGEIVIYETIFETPGVVEAALMAQNSAALIKKFTGHGGRHGRGRAYVPGVLQEGFVNQAGHINTTDQNNLTTAFEAFRAQLLSHNLEIALLHSDATVPYLVTSLQCDNRIATQRRRLRR